MKKIKKNLFGIGLALAMIMGIGFSFVPKSVNAEEPEEWYEVIWHFEYSASNNTWYYVTECTDTPGDECNMPGSIHRTKIWED